MNLVRAVSTEGVGRLKYHRDVRQRRDQARRFQLYFDQETTELPILPGPGTKRFGPSVGVSSRRGVASRSQRLCQVRAELAGGRHFSVILGGTCPRRIEPLCLLWTIATGVQTIIVALPDGSKRRPVLPLRGIVEAAARALDQLRLSGNDVSVLDHQRGLRERNRYSEVVQCRQRIWLYTA